MAVLYWPTAKACQSQLLLLMLSSFIPSACSPADSDMKREAFRFTEWITFLNNIYINPLYLIMLHRCQKVSSKATVKKKQTKKTNTWQMCNIVLV